ncbi:MAG: cupin domain-containing protein [Actinomycetota bacterium]
MFVSPTSGAWELDDDPPGEVQFLVSDGALQAGLWPSVPGVTPNPVRWTLPAREVIVVLEGSARIEIEGGPTLELRAGDAASMPEGSVTTGICRAVSENCGC